MTGFVSSRWLIVIIGFFVLSLTFSIRSTIGLVMPVWSAEMEWSRSFISTGGAICLVVMALIAPFAGNAVDRFGARKLIVGGMLIIALATVLIAIMKTQWLFLIAYSAIAGVGFGVVAMHVIVTTISPLFDKNRGLATGVATAGATAGQLLIVPLFAVMLGSYNWRDSYMFLAIICVLVAILCWRLLPKKFGVAVVQTKNEQDKPSLSEQLRWLVKKPIFHALFWSFTLCGFTTAGVIETHLLPYIVACGYPPLTSAVAYGALSAFNMVGMIIAGYLSDRVNRVYLLVGIYLLRAASFVVLMYIVDDYALLVIFSVAFGLFDYSTVPVTASLIASHLGMRIMGLTLGVLAMGHAFGAAVGAYMGGYLFDIFARYQEVWIASVILAALAAFMVMGIKDRESINVPAMVNS